MIHSPAIAASRSPSVGVAGAPAAGETAVQSFAGAHRLGKHVSGPGVPRCDGPQVARLQSVSEPALIDPRPVAALHELMAAEPVVRVRPAVIEWPTASDAAEAP